MKYLVHFAPLQGFTDAVLRNAHEKVFGGVDSYYTPFVRLEKGDTFRRRELVDIEKENNRVCSLIPQLIAGTPCELEKISALFIEKGYTRADINLGCPFPMLARRHKGSGILPFPGEVAALLSATRHIPELEFSVKLRLGWDCPEESLALLPILNDYPFSQIVLHARVGRQQYKGDVDMEGFGAFYEGIRHPLVYNGDLRTVEDIEKITSRFPRLAGIMIGRGMLADPALAMEYQKGKTLSNDVKCKMLCDFHRELLQHYEARLQGDAQLLAKLKPFWEYLMPDLEKKLRKRILKSTKKEDYLRAVNEATATGRL